MAAEPLRAEQLLREGILAQRAILVAGVAVGGAVFGDAIADACERLAARVVRLELAGRSDAEVDEAVAAAGAVDVLVTDAASLFAGPGDRAGGADALRACLDACWSATRAVANVAFIGASSEGSPAAPARGGRIVNVAPPPGAGAHASAARAGLENLARTLSIEWARHGVVTTTIAPADATPASEVASLVAFLASPAGGYYSGCRFDLSG